VRVSGRPFLAEEHWLHVAPGMTWRLLLTLSIYSAISAAASIGLSDIAVMLVRSSLPAAAVRISIFILISCTAIASGDFALCRLKKIIHW
jgi:hypothetical protein